MDPKNKKEETHDPKKCDERQPFLCVCPDDLTKSFIVDLDIHNIINTTYDDFINLAYEQANELYSTKEDKVRWEGFVIEHADPMSEAEKTAEYNENQLENGPLENLYDRMPFHFWIEMVPHDYQKGDGKYIRCESPNKVNYVVFDPNDTAEMVIKKIQAKDKDAKKS